MTRAAAPAVCGTAAERAEIIEVVDARIALETEACRLAAERRSTADLRAIGSALAARHERLDDLDELISADLVFHRKIVVAAHSRVILEMFDVLTPKTRAAMIALLRAGVVTTDPPDHHAHVRMAEAIRARDGALAADLSRAHLSALRAHVH